MTAQRRSTTFRLDDDLFDGMQEVWQRDGVQPSEQVRRALRMWLKSRGIKTKRTVRPAVNRPKRS